MVPPENNNGNRVRLDVWLDVACLFRTRSEAQRACRGGKVDVNNQRAKPHRDIRAGDEIAITRLHGVKQMVEVRALADRHLPKSAARALYDDRTPPPSAAADRLRSIGMSSAVSRIAPAKKRTARGML